MAPLNVTVAHIFLSEIVTVGNTRCVNLELDLTERCVVNPCKVPPGWNEWASPNSANWPSHATDSGLMAGS